jgi:chemotaxis signal transduction protein
MTKRLSSRKKKKPSPRRLKKQVKSSNDQKTPPDVTTENKLAVFRVGEEMYAFHLDSIIETLYNYSVKPVAHLPDIYKGILTFQNASLPVVSLRELLRVGEVSSSTPVCIVVVMNGDRMGFLADTDIDIVPETMGQMYPLPDCYTLEEAEFIEGIFWLDQRFIGILNPRRMMEVLVGWRKSNETK